MDNFEKTVALYKAMNENYCEATESAYYSALDEYGFMDSQIVDECWSYQISLSVALDKIKTKNRK